MGILGSGMEWSASDTDNREIILEVISKVNDNNLRLFFAFVSAPDALA